jgi:long-subunit acyl-CoA synthetase (AMP-forming)
VTESNILHLYRKELDKPRDEHYFHFSPEGQRVLSTGAFFERTANFASGLEKLGIGRGDRVMLLMDNRPEWHLSDLAIVDLGAVDTPVYGTLNPAQVAYQAKDSGAKAAVVEKPDQMAKFLEIDASSRRTTQNSSRVCTQTRFRLLQHPAWPQKFAWKVASLLPRGFLRDEGVFGVFPGILAEQKRDADNKGSKAWAEAHAYG